MLAANFYAVIETGVIMGGIATIALIIAMTVYAFQREEKERPLLPWGARMRVERAKAALELDAVEIKRIALDHQRTRVLRAIQDDDHDTVKALGLPGVNTRQERYE